MMLRAAAGLRAARLRRGSPASPLVVLPHPPRPSRSLPTSVPFSASAVHRNPPATVIGDGMGATPSMIPPPTAMPASAASPESMAARLDSTRVLLQHVDAHKAAVAADARIAPSSGPAAAAPTTATVRPPTPAAHPAPAPASPLAPLDPIILPPLLAGSKKKKAPGGHPYSLLVFQEYLAVLHALVKARQMDRAEKIFAHLAKKNPAEMRQVMDTAVYNVLIEGWMDCVRPPVRDDAGDAVEDGKKVAADKVRAQTGALRSGLMWFLRMKGESVVPNATTWALVLRGLLRAHELQLVALYLAEARKASKATADDVLFGQIMAHAHLTTGLDDALVPMWHAVLNKSGIRLPQRNAVGMIPDLVARAAGAEALAATPAAKATVKEELAAVSTAVLTEATKHVLEADRQQLPHALPVGSMGLDLLKRNLSVMQDQIGSSEFSKYARQLKLEEEAYNAALDRLREENKQMADMPLIRNATLKRYMWDWHGKLTTAIDEELAVINGMNSPVSKASEVRDERELYGPLLAQLSAEKLAMITIVEMLRLHVPSQAQTADENETQINDVTKVNRAVITIGAAIESEINAQELRARMKAKGSGGAMQDWTASYLDERLFSSPRLFNMTVRKLYAQMQEQNDAMLGDGIDESKMPDGLSSGMWLHKWPQSTRAKVGSVLVSMLLKVAEIEREVTDPTTGATTVEKVPAFHHTYTFHQGKLLGVIKYHATVSEMLSRDPVKNTLSPKLLPMLVKPRPWLTYMSGGYLTSRSPCMRIKDGNPEQLAYLRASAKNNRLNYILASLDVLGSTPWRINEQVFKVVLQVWNDGKAIADLPPHVNDELKNKMIPKEPESKDPVVRREYLKKLEEANTFIRNAYSLRCDTNYKVEVARTFLGENLYFPHNIDFRGRAYPMPVHLNHISSDLCRGLLTFAERRPLGARGWFWLKVHMASLHGYDKQSFTAREQWVMDNIDNIYDSADNPLDGKKWWLKADDPWQCLATCYEITAAMRSGNPETYASSLPVHQDGTCNGLQHYAALGGDVLGAEQVNLIKGDRPADVYTAVATQVAELVAKDAANPKCKEQHLAQLLDGHVSRKVVKQTVMTNVYGVTFIGARQQIQNRLKELKEFNSDQTYTLAAYLARKVFLSIGKIFHGAQRIQDWLNESARLISKSVPAQYVETNPAAMSSVIWTTPLGLTCVQPYRKELKTQVKTDLQTIMLADPNNPAPVNVMKQRSAFPPNFIHSLDASHMMMTAIKCHQQGLTFASVHDSYWTHACDVDAMNEVIRDQFIQLHSQPIMDNLVREFQMRYKGYMIPAKALEKKAAKKPAGGAASVDEDGNEVEVEADSAADAAAAEEVVDEAPMRRMRRKKGDPKPDEWVPLVLPPLPPRGSFDVKSVKESDYFFH
ncbi:DNA-directed RNA polymerase [Allomyces javanicus]|nr:DNA-directed RNA polymerase [Allomyces javanicus]